MMISGDSSWQKKARYRLKGEKYTKYWFNLNGNKYDDQVILALKNKEGKLVKDTREMAAIAKEYHENLQKRPEMTEERERAIEALEEITEDRLDKEQIKALKKETTKENILAALKKAKNGTSPGLDGIPYKYYKKVNARLDKNPQDEKIPDIGKMLYLLINDIEQRGIIKMDKDIKQGKSDFTDSLMYLLYKKKDKWNIENYHPLALLNTDYKLYTKSIAEKLVDVCHILINEDQAGFVPGRNIQDHTKNTQTIIEYCELVKKNGCIIALDQEKVYDILFMGLM